MEKMLSNCSISSDMSILLPCRPLHSRLLLSQCLVAAAVYLSPGKTASG